MCKSLYTYLAVCFAFEKPRWLLHTADRAETVFSHLNRKSVLGFCHVISAAILAFRWRCLPFFVSQSGEFCFLSHFYHYYYYYFYYYYYLFIFLMVGRVQGYCSPEVLCHCFRCGTHFHLFWSHVRSVFSVVFHIGRGLLLKVFPQLYCNI